MGQGGPPSCVRSTGTVSWPPYLARRKHSGHRVYFARPLKAACPSTLVQREGPPGEVVRDVRLVVHELVKMNEENDAF